MYQMYKYNRSIISKTIGKVQVYNCLKKNLTNNNQQILEKYKIVLLKNSLPKNFKLSTYDFFFIVDFLKIYKTSNVLIHNLPTYTYKLSGKIGHSLI